jgi:lipopolysaccharide export system protein LptC
VIVCWGRGRVWVHGLDAMGDNLSTPLSTDMLRELGRAEPAWFRAAVRHSRFVRLLRTAIPVTIAGVFALLIVAAYFNPFRVFARLPIDPGKIVLSGTRITMESPRVAGFTNDARPYEVTARAASQDITKPDIVDLEDIHAKVQMQDKVLVEMRANSGVYESKLDRLKLDHEIVLTSTSGYAGHLREAVIDVKKGSIVSQSPVELKMLNGTLNANHLEVDDRGDVIRFGGGVVMNLTLDNAQQDTKR